MTDTPDNRPRAGHLIDGHWSQAGTLTDVLDPADGSVVGSVRHGGAAEASAAADAAGAAFPGWADTPARARADVLNRAAETIRGHADELGLLLARESGKRVPEAVAEIGLSAEYLRWFAEQCRRPDGAVYPHEADDRRHLSVRRPAGVAACLTPWNFPCSIQARKLAAALAAGCTVVARVSERAPLAVTEMFRHMADAGLPPGVLNLVHGPAAEITGAYLEHPSVRVVSFTGSTEVGSTIMAKAAGRIVRPLLELGGNAPFLVFDDADLDRAADAAMLAKFRNTGQSCIAANRFLVHESVHDEFVQRLSARIDAMTVGPGWAEPVPDLAACIGDDRVRAVSALVEQAVSAGGKVVTRAADPPGTGAFHAPALVVDAPDDADLATTEVFGPAAGVFRFSDEDEALRRANDTEMGLAAYAFTRDADRLWRMGERLQAGIIGFNHPLPTACFAPMGGVKQSGLGREGSDVGLEEFQDIHYVAVGL
ncbi:succinate semialdehyde dehydrogenase [Haloactinopolyspora alba]|uniref:Succinate semialdehyde dehydrogenase n=1 Tax=Haloactinopolyspora alba TaxID=648780 RepID=A0A2P8EG11_9ACTN|nr:aldehyde dehydrogenase family protein [Haloactinopolyspora alba]PSL08399.1 succinate semialdehyde dehydrogenase [Haloactinopolyspora alba]